MADTFDAMTTDRPYRNGLSVELALEELRKNTGTQFDSGVVDAFIKAYENNRSELTTNPDLASDVLPLEKI